MWRINFEIDRKNTPEDNPCAARAHTVDETDEPFQSQLNFWPRSNSAAEIILECSTGIWGTFRTPSPNTADAVL